MVHEQLHFQGHWSADTRVGLPGLALVSENAISQADCLDLVDMRLYVIIIINLYSSRVIAIFTFYNGSSVC